MITSGKFALAVCCMTSEVSWPGLRRMAMSVVAGLVTDGRILFSASVLRVSRSTGLLSSLASAASKISCASTVALDDSWDTWSRREENRLSPMLIDMYAPIRLTAMLESRIVMATVRNCSEVRQKRATAAG